MSQSINQSIPGEIRTGETVTWQTTPQGYPPADGWTMTTYFRGIMPGVNVVAVADGAGYTSTLTAEQSEKLAAGRCDWQTWVTRGAGATLEQYQIDEGHTTVEIGFVDLDPNTPYDGRTRLEQQLDAVRVALGEKAAKDAWEYQIANRMKREHTFEDLLRWEKRLVELVNAERRAAGAASGSGFFKIIRVRPVEPGP